MEIKKIKNFSYIQIETAEGIMGIEKFPKNIITKKMIKIQMEEKDWDKYLLYAKYGKNREIDELLWNVHEIWYLITNPIPLKKKEIESFIDDPIDIASIYVALKSLEWIDGKPFTIVIETNRPIKFNGDFYYGSVNEVDLYATYFEKGCKLWDDELISVYISKKIFKYM